MDVARCHPHRVLASLYASDFSFVEKLEDLAHKSLFMCTHWIDLWVLDSSYTHYPPSFIAASCLYQVVLVLCRGADDRASPVPRLVFPWIKIASGYDYQDIAKTTLVFDWIQAMIVSLKALWKNEPNDAISYPLFLYHSQVIVDEDESKDEYQRHYDDMQSTLRATRALLFQTWKSRSLVQP